jgi:hypothetical protein
LLRNVKPFNPGIKSLPATLPAEIFWWGLLIFKGVTARRLCKSLGVKGLMVLVAVVLKESGEQNSGSNDMKLGNKSCETVEQFSHLEKETDESILHSCGNL